jgi:DNA-binding NarL/FixJ family response regulator
MIRETSQTAYEELKDELPLRQYEVLGQLTKGEDFTNMEIAEALGRSINTITGRVFELRKQGLVRLNGKRHCHITGKLVMAWTLNK